MGKLIDFIYSFLEKYFRPKNKTWAIIGGISCTAIPIVLCMFLAIFVFDNSIPLVIFIVLYGFTFLQASIYFFGEVQKFKNQEESSRRKSTDNYYFYRIKIHNTGGWDVWQRIDMNNGFEDYYKNFLLPGEQQGIVEIDRGGLTDAQKKKINREKSLGGLIK